jgi:hypothetical protein
MQAAIKLYRGNVPRAMSGKLMSIEGLLIKVIVQFVLEALQQLNEN